MLDDLLGRTELKARIEDLEDEKRHLKRQLDAESERAADAKSARQAAEERENRLQDRVADLEGQIEGASESVSENIEFRRRERLRGARLSRVLDRLDGFGGDPESAFTGMIESVDTGDLPEHAREAIGERLALLGRATPCVVCVDDAGVVCVALDPPRLPDNFATWAEGFDLDREWFEPTGAFALAVVRSDVFAMGEYEGRDRHAFEGFESDVMGTHSKGGFSQGRFERRRDDQIAEHLDRCRETIDAREADRLYVVGQRTLLGEFEEAADATAAADATGTPREALDAGFEQFWTTGLYAL